MQPETRRPTCFPIREGDRHPVRARRPRRTPDPARLPHPTRDPARLPHPMRDPAPPSELLALDDFGRRYRDGLDGHVAVPAARAGADLLDPPDHVQSLDDASEDCVADAVLRAL